ncbi:MAG TPA: hypothetical protein PLO43_01665, partial [Chlamydiales bacterium]|nr:hypothetical protein [Chlamydiales bacterium]
MRILSTLVSLAVIGGGLWWVDGHYPSLKYIALEKINTAQVLSLEIKYTPKQIIDHNKGELLRSTKHKCQSHDLKFAPYLLMEVKYSKNAAQTGEGVILWDMTDGEMVMNTKHWEKTHGYGDCITTHASSQDFGIINELVKKGGVCDQNTLLQTLNIENDPLDTTIDACKRKKLIVQIGQRYRLHMAGAKFTKEPETLITSPLVTTTHSAGERLTKRFSAAQIKKNAQAAFGSE